MVTHSLLSGLVHWWPQRTTNSRSHQQLSPYNIKQIQTNHYIVPNTTQQHTSPPIITTVSNTLYNRESWITQHAISPNHNQHTTWLQTAIQPTRIFKLQERRLDTIYRWHRVRSRSDHHTHCKLCVYKYNPYGRQSRYTNG